MSIGCLTTLGTIRSPPGNGWRGSRGRCRIRPKALSCFVSRTDASIGRQGVGFQNHISGATSPWLSAQSRWPARISRRGAGFSGLLVTQESAATLAEIVCEAAVDWPAAELCCAALRSTSRSLVGERASKAHLVRTYTVRLTNPDPAAGVIGLERLLADFDAYPRQGLVGFVHTSEARRIHTMFFDDAVDYFMVETIP